MCVRHHYQLKIKTGEAFNKPQSGQISLRGRGVNGIRNATVEIRARLTVSPLSSHLSRLSSDYFSAKDTAFIQIISSTHSVNNLNGNLLSVA